uniref:Peroxisomal ATPase PEX6 n=1 Tax=Callorhinchus milii TaxID=7868 RepID=A0A4W3JZK2_CALMI
DSCLVLSRPALRRLGLFNREWLALWLLEAGGQEPGPVSAGARWASVLVVDDPGLELGATDCALCPQRVYETGHVGRCGKDSRSVLSVPPLTSELHLETITAPQYSVGEEYDSVLCQHFLTARSDVCVCVSDWCFSLLQAGCTNSFVPSYAACAGNPVWGSVAPPGLAHTVDQLSDIMLPYLQTGPSVLAGPCSVLLWGPSGSGKATVVGATCYRLHLHLVKVECSGLCGDSVGATEARLTAVFSVADTHRPCVLLLRNVQRLAAERDGVGEDPRLVATLHRLLTELYPVLVVGTAGKMRDLGDGAQAAFLHHVELETLSEQHRRELLSALSAGLPLGSDVNLSKISQQTAGTVLGDMCALLSHASRAACERARSGCRPSEREDLDLSAAGVCVQAQDFQNALDRLQSSNARALGAPKIPCVHWQDVGGLRDVKQEILDTIQLPLAHRELLTQGLRRSGLLLYGPPGTGKTLLAKAVATECSMSFLSVKGPELINMYVGQSEENVREVFARARAAAPCIVFFDELDSLAPNRGRSGDSGGVMDRVVSQLLAELDGLHSSGDVFVIGATNRPDLLDQALLRPGRFDKLLYVGITEDPEAQLRVLEAITRKQISRIQQGLDTEESELLLTQEDFESALSTLEPSVSELELSRYRQLQYRLSGK